jgi:hypothetical protein
VVAAGVLVGVIAAVMGIVAPALGRVRGIPATPPPVIAAAIVVPAASGMLPTAAATTAAAGTRVSRSPAANTTTMRDSSHGIATPLRRKARVAWRTTVHRRGLVRRL